MSWSGFAQRNAGPGKYCGRTRGMTTIILTGLCDTAGGAGRELGPPSCMPLPGRILRLHGWLIYLSSTQKLLMVLATEKKTVQMKMGDKIPSKVAMVRSRSLNVNRRC